MREIEKIVAAIERIIAAGKRGIVATVAHTKGSTYRRAGARCVVSEDGETVGAISGGCLERDLAERAKAWGDDFGARVITYDSSRFDDIVFGLGLGCRGNIEIVVQPFDAAHPPELPQESEPARAVVIFGGGTDVEPVATLGRTIGWSVDVIAPKDCHPESVASSIELSKYDAAIVMTHNFLYDAALLEALFATAIPYIGLLGPKARGDELMERLSATEEMRQRLYNPIGLDLGGETPEEIALSIVGELQAVFNHRRTDSLRDKSGPIHESALQPKTWT
jgi:xanthine/CO dehydrogenase XdhC/CoxF family maturation factor